MYRYFLPENRRQYQKFGFDQCTLMGALDKPQFFNFLKVDLPESIPYVDNEIREKKTILTFANELAKNIKDRGERYLFLYLAFLPNI